MPWPWSLVLALALVAGAVPAHAADPHCATAPACPGAAAVPAAPCPPHGAVLRIVATNLRPTDSVALTVEGELLCADATCTPGNGLAAAYGPLSVTCAGAGPGPVACTPAIGDLLPGAWVHRMTAGAQHQAQRSVVLATTNGGGSNVVAWTVYREDHVLLASSETALRDALCAAESRSPALILFDRAQLPAPGGAPTLALTHRQCEGDAECVSACNQAPCTVGAHCAALFVGASQLTIDGLGDVGEPGVTLTVEQNAGLLRVYGHDDVLRGVRLVGSQSGGTEQKDTLAFTGGGAVRDRLEESVVVGPDHGDAIGIDGGAGGSDPANTNAVTVLASEVRAAEDKGVKAAGGAAVVLDSAVCDNRNGGLQATLGGAIAARRNVVQHNAPGAAENGIFSVGDLGDGPESRAHLFTEGNVVRLNGASGLSVGNNASGDFANDYVADNQFSGARVRTSRPGVVPDARFTGLALVCNHHAGLSGVCKPDDANAPPLDPPVFCLGDAGDCARTGTCCPPSTSCKDTFPAGAGASAGFDPGCPGCATGDASCACLAPLVDYGDPTGGNAFTLNKNSADGANLIHAAPGTAVSARGDQWEHGCPNGTCSAASAAQDVSAPDADVELDPVLSPNGAAPALVEAVPRRPARGGLVRLYADALAGPFDAIHGAACDAGALQAVEPCDPRNCSVATANRTSGGNHVRLRMNGITYHPDVYAVTPTMLVFRMPVDCFSGARIWVEGPGGRSNDLDGFCDPGGCAGAPDGTPCEDGNACTLGDTCQRENCVAGPSCAAGKGCAVCDPSVGCVPRLAQFVCRTSAGACDPAETCDGTSLDCPADALAPAGVKCRNAPSNCDAPEFCDGVSPLCPPDAFAPPAKVCRSSTGPCDPRELCTGTSADCPPDAHVPAGGTCVGDDDHNPCTADTCDAGGMCHHDPGNAGAVCRAAHGLCDVVERCPGDSTVCPPDAVAPAGTLCRAATGDCDVAATCDGTRPTCAADLKAQKGTPCTDDGNPCTTDACDDEGRCAHASGNADVVCRRAVGPCDVAERCTGTSADCPPDELQPAGFSCRPTAGECDVAETCTGTDAACPADVVKPTGAACELGGDPCRDSCAGTACRHRDALADADCHLAPLKASVTSCGRTARRLENLGAAARAALRRAAQACARGNRHAAGRELRSGVAVLRQLVALAARHPCAAVARDRATRALAEVQTLAASRDVCTP